MHSETLTDEMIQTLRDEAGEYGDAEQVEICDYALDGDEESREECARVINAQRSTNNETGYIVEFVRVVA